MVRVWRESGESLGNKKSPPDDPKVTKKEGANTPLLCVVVI